MAEVIAQATTQQPCKCCGLQIAGYYCRSLQGGGRFVGFREYAGYESTPTRYYRRGVTSGTISSDAIKTNEVWYFQARSESAFFNLCRAGKPDWQEVDTPGLMTACTPACQTGYIFTGDQSYFLPGNLSGSGGTGGLDTDDMGVSYFYPDTVVTANSVFYNTLLFRGFPVTTAGSYGGRLELECTMDDAFTAAECNGLPANVEGEECRAYTTLLNDNNLDFPDYQKVEGQSCVVFLTIVNATVGGSVRVEAQFEERGLSSGTLIGTQEVIIDFSAPQSSFVLRVDVPTPAVDRQITFIAAGIQKAGDGGTVTYEDDTGAYRVDD